MELITYKITGQIALITVEGDILKEGEMLRKDRVEERDKSR